MEEEFFLCFSCYKYMGVNFSLDGAILNTRGIIGRIFVKHYITLLRTKYTSCGSSAQVS